MEFPTQADEDAAKQDYLRQLQEERKRQIDAYEDPATSKCKRSKLKYQYNPKDEFKTFSLNLPANAFPHLIKTVALEDTGEGQKGCILVHADPEQGTPMVRSTTVFQNAVQLFQSLHHQLANEIRAVAQLPLPLNNCVVQWYDKVCTGADLPFGSSPTQDLAFCEDSYICLFSCYQDPANTNRKLLVESKTPHSKLDPFEIPLAPNSVVVWSLETNRHFRTKVVLDGGEENPWMGFTFRTSSTCIHYTRESGDDKTRAYFANGMPLVLLEGDRACSTTHRLRELENEGTDFVYPSCMMSTISPGDLLPPIDTSVEKKKENGNK